jgi:hypothetical protein
MKKGTKVSWLVDGMTNRGHGITIADEDNGSILVAVHDLYSEPFVGYHIVIYCTVTWLTVES